MKRAALLVLLALVACGGAPPPLSQPAPKAEPPQPPPVAKAPDPDVDVPVVFHGPLTTPMPGGLTAQFWRGNDGSGLCEIEFAFLGGAGSAKPGTADYAAEALLALGDSTSGRPPLRQRIQSLGGGVQVSVGPGSVWIGLRVPEPNLFAALSALRAAVNAAEPTRAPLERVRDELVKERLAALHADPLGFAARRLLLGDRGPADHIASLQDRDPTDVVLFLQRQCRPENAVLAVRSSGELADTGRAVAGNFASWKLPPLAAPPPPPARALRPGLYWAPSQAPVCRVALLLPLLPQRHGHALLQQVLLACLTLEGSGGRLERMLDAAGLPDLDLHVRQLDQAESCALLLETRLAPDQVATFWRTAGNALRSLQQTPPSASELALATARARLTAWRDDASTGTAFRSRAARLLRGESDDQLQKRLLAPVGSDPTLQAATLSMLQLPVCMIAIGGAPPAGIAAEVLPLALPPDEGALAAADPARAEAAARELDAALQAAGGRQRLLQVDGFRSTSELRGDGAAPVREELTFRRSGQLQRKLEVLRTAVETSIDGARQVESDGTASRPLRPREADFLQKAQARHPLMLLCAAARGELHCRLVAVRTLQGRDTTILEVETGGSERLRLHFDAESHLLRLVESWGADPDGTPRYLQESWSDFRTASGLRVPFRRLSDVDDGQSRVESRCTSFTPLIGG